MSKINNIYLSKLTSILKIEPIKENETVIRNLCHILLGEIKELGDSEPEISSAVRKSCLRHIRKLQLDKIMHMNKTDCTFLKYNFSHFIYNLCCAFDILMTKSGLYISQKPSYGIYAVCDPKLVFYGVSGIIYILYLYGCSGEIEVTVRKIGSLVVLSAVCRESKRKNGNCEKISEEIEVLRKNAALHSGAFFLFLGKKKTEAALTFGISSDSGAASSNPPHYIDMLLDRNSDIYVGLSFLDE